MTVVVGFAPEARGRGGLELGSLLSRSGGGDLVVCCVVPDRWEVPSMARVDASYAAHLRELAEAALERARSILGPDARAEYVVRTGRSVPAALLAETDERSARVLVGGSSSDGSWGHVVLGSVTDRLLHSAHVPLALAPRGYRCGAVGRVDRVTVAVDGTPASHGVLAEAARVTREVGARLRVVTFAVRNRTMYPPETGLHAEDAVVAAWREQAEGFLAETLAVLAEQPDVAVPEEALIVDGPDWASALGNAEWSAGDLLVVGSSRMGPIARVFLGSTATHIVRHSPVPVLLLPSSAT